MTSRTNWFLRLALASVVGVGCLFGSETLSPIDPGSWTTKAQAIIGRPATPLSFAGVARRTTRRAVVGGAAAAGAAAAYSAYPAPGCVQVVNAYGQIFYQCP
jgi:hypothetical protein